MRRLASLLAFSALAGCTVGPNYSGPPATSAPPAFVRAGDAPVSATPPLARWWEALGDPSLDALVTQALAANPDLAVTQARLRQARAQLSLARANQRPSASATALYAHARLPGLDLNQVDASNGSAGGDQGSGGGGTSALNLYNIGFDASWELDLFGGGVRQRQAARADVGAAEANLADAQVSLTAEVVQAYVNLRDRQARIALNAQSVAMQEQMLALTRQRYAQGTASEIDVSRLETELEGTRADVVPLSAERDSFLDELAVLTGQAPGALDANLAAPAPVPLPPAAVAIGDPARLIADRPDIRAAERTLAADTARVGVQEAARLPRLNLMGILGVGGTALSDLTKLDDFTLLAAPQLSWSFLDLGRGRARVEQAKGVRDEAEARYRSAVLGALRDAEGALTRFRTGRITVATLARAEAAAANTARLSQQRYDAGTGTRIELLDAQRQEIAARGNFSLAQANLTQDYVAISKALGLGWQAEPAPKP